MELNKEYKQTVTVKNYSVYCNDEYSTMFRKLYKGIIVRVSAAKTNPQYCWFTIKSKKTKEAIFKSPFEKMYSIVFNDSDCSITCDFEALEKNKFPHTLSFDSEVYEELKETIPVFMEESGCMPKGISNTETSLKLMF